jgi:hypothetical protein
MTQLISRQRMLWLLLIFTLWLVLVSVALFYFGNQDYGQFDANQNWQASAPSTLAIEALGIVPSAGKQVVHVQQPHCSCNSRAIQNRAIFTDEYQLPAMRQFQRELGQVNAAGLMLPATPAVLIFNNGKLLYAGPYATGPMCSVSNSLIAPILTGEVTLTGLWLNGEAKACRCLSKPE